MNRPVEQDAATLALSPEQSEGIAALNRRLRALARKVDARVERELVRSALLEQDRRIRGARVLVPVASSSEPRQLTASLGRELAAKGRAAVLRALGALS